MSTLDFRVKNGLVVNEVAQVLSTTDSSSKDSGALIVEGGVGIEKKLYVGTDLNVLGATTLTGDLAVNGGDITTSSATATIFNSPTTLSIGQAATSLSIGQTSGTTTVRNALTVGGAFTANSGAGSLSPANASITISPTGTGNVVISPATSGSIDNMTIGLTTAKDSKFVNTTITGTLTAGGVTGTTGQALVSTGTGIAWATPARIDNDNTNVVAADPIVTVTADGTLATTFYSTYVQVHHSADASSTATGALRVSGGLGVGGKIYAASIQNTPIGSSQQSSGAFTSLSANAQVNFTAGTAAGNGSGTVTVSGGIYTSGGLWIAGSSTFAGFSSTSTTTLSPANASVAISPTGTGTVTINPATTGSINNMTIGGTTAKAGTFTDVNLTTGNVNFTTAQDGTGIYWARNTDGASIKFYNTGDGDTNSRLEFEINDNTNEYFRFTGVSGGTTTELMTIRPDGGQTGLKFRGNTVWHAGNDGSGSGLDADTVDGLELHTGRNNEVNKIVRTDANGYIQAGWINTTSGDNGTTAIDRVYASSDSYIRYYTPANFRQVLDVPTRTGGNASGTWAINISGNAATASDSSLLNGISAVNLFNNMGQGHSTRTDANASYDFGFRFIQGSTNTPNFNGTTQHYSFYTGLGSDYNYTTYGSQVAWARDVTEPYIAIRYKENTTWSAWRKINAGKADNLTTTRSNWSTNGTISAVVGQLAWKNYGNSHTIFDASAGTSPDGTSVNNTNPGVNWSATYPTLMGWNGSSTYGVRVDVSRLSESCSGNAATATLAANTSSISSAVGGSYTWTGTQYFQSNLGSTSGSLSSPPLQVYSTSNNAAFMSFHKGGQYAINMGLDSDNVFRIGGWSASANRLQMDMSGNLTMAGFYYASVPLYKNAQSLNGLTISSGENAVSAGPITIPSGQTVTVNGNWSIV